MTDGEQRRDSYASFVGSILDNCQLIPLTDLLPLVDDPEEFARELRALDVPASLTDWLPYPASEQVMVHSLITPRAVRCLPFRTASSLGV